MKSLRDKKLDAVWKHKHADYKGKIDGMRYVLVYRQGTTSVPLSSLTDAEIEDNLPAAVRAAFTKEAENPNA